MTPTLWLIVDTRLRICCRTNLKDHSCCVTLLRMSICSVSASGGMVAVSTPGLRIMKSTTSSALTVMIQESTWAGTSLNSSITTKYDSEFVQNLNSIFHCQDPASCMFFEPMLTTPVNRRTPFSLQSLSRAVICDSLQNYSDVDNLELPKTLKSFLKEYHYRHKISIKRYDL